MNNCRPQSELSIVTKAKELCSYIITVTQKSPKQFRFTIVTRLQNLALDIIGEIYKANDVFVNRGDFNALNFRLSLQREAMTNIKLLAYYAELALTMNAILMKQYCQIAKLTTDCQNLLGAWMNSDRRRWQ